jgi:hypothetical protein
MQNKILLLKLGFKEDKKIYIYGAISIKANFKKYNQQWKRL